MYTFTYTYMAETKGAMELTTQLSIQGTHTHTHARTHARTHTHTHTAIELTERLSIQADNAHKLDSQRVRVQVVHKQLVHRCFEAPRQPPARGVAHEGGRVLCVSCTSD